MSSSDERVARAQLAQRREPHRRQAGAARSSPCPSPMPLTHSTSIVVAERGRACASSPRCCRRRAAPACGSRAEQPRRVDAQRQIAARCPPRRSDRPSPRRRDRPSGFSSPAPVARSVSVAGKQPLGRRTSRCRARASPTSRSGAADRLSALGAVPTALRRRHRRRGVGGAGAARRRSDRRRLAHRRAPARRLRRPARGARRRRLPACGSARLGAAARRLRRDRLGARRARGRLGSSSRFACDDIGSAASRSSASSAWPFSRRGVAASPSRSRRLRRPPRRPRRRRRRSPSPLRSSPARRRSRLGLAGVAALRLGGAAVLVVLGANGVLLAGGARARPARASSRRFAAAASAPPPPPPRRGRRRLAPLVGVVAAARLRRRRRRGLGGFVFGLDGFLVVLGVLVLDDVRLPPRPRRRPRRRLRRDAPWPVRAPCTCSPLSIDEGRLAADRRVGIDRDGDAGSAPPARADARACG